ncbi:arginase family protein [Actinomadura fulvescens]|uniref:Arginase family protein n=1 Tax=Actinomadura fulvescens TaxID=46160 RepID=A0ABN3PGU1_9ACTN
MARSVALLGVPSSAGTHGPGEEKAPAALRAAGLAERLAAAGVTVTDHGDLPASVFRPDPARRTAQNAEQVAAVARSVRDALLPLLDGPELPVLIGGDCTITIGAVAALTARWPDAGLLYFDGDLDLSTPETTMSGVLDTMVLSHLLGDGIDELRDLGPRVPLLPAERIVAFGHEPRELNDAGRERLARYGLRTTPCGELAGAKEDEAADRARREWEWLRGTAGPVLLHFDVDVIDSTDLPLANFPHFNEGLAEPIAMRCLREFCARPGLAALVVTEINPDRDPDGTLLDRFVDGLVAALAGTAADVTA